MNAERRRLQEVTSHAVPWRKWGPYVAERQWGTVREDYSSLGTAWETVSHDHARSQAYRWGEEGIAGISDDGQHLCFVRRQHLWDSWPSSIGGGIGGVSAVGRSDCT